VIGKAADCDLVVNDPALAPHHCRLIDTPRGLILEDLHSAAGTFVNGTRVYGRTRITRADKVRLGEQLTLPWPPPGPAKPERTLATLTARNVTVEAPGRRLLEGVSFTVFPCELVGIMGTSGAGKTTLLNALNGYAKPTTGEVLLNGRDLYSDQRVLAGLLGYVPQDDIMHRELTAGEALFYSARLRLPRLPGRELRQRIRAILKQLGIESAEHVVIGSPERRGISGGQRKRVNLALELLTDPLVLLLDEPTSGLSSEEALTVMQMLRDLADAGTTVIVTIHQPSLGVFRMLDGLAVVSKDVNSASPGKLVYYGPAYPDALRFFNPTETVEGPWPAGPEDVLRGAASEPTRDWVARYESSALRQEHVKDRARRVPWGKDQLHLPSQPLLVGLRQWWTLTRRALTIQLRGLASTLVLLAQAPLIALLIVLVYRDQLPKQINDDTWLEAAPAAAVVLFLTALAALWFGCTNAVRTIVGEWAVYQRERMVNLRLRSYLASKLTILGTLGFFQCLVLLAIVHWGCNLKGPWWPMFGLLYLTALIGTACGLVLSALARTTEFAIALVPLVILPMIILGGTMHPIHKMTEPMQVVTYGIASRWAFEGLLTLESEQQPRYPQKKPAPPVVPIGVKPPPEPVIEKRDFAEYYFPKADRRWGAPACGWVLSAMLAALIGVVALVLRARELR
jgi:ABC-type multidrug transport system ATPase subunit